MASLKGTLIIIVDPSKAQKTHQFFYGLNLGIRIIIYNYVHIPFLTCDVGTSVSTHYEGRKCGHMYILHHSYEMRLCKVMSMTVMFTLLHTMK